MRAGPAFCWSPPTRVESGATVHRLIGRGRSSAGRSRTAGDPYSFAAAELAQSRAAPIAGLPPFAGGAVGMFAYDLVRAVEPARRAQGGPARAADLALMMTDALVAFDHLGRTITVIANVYGDDDLEASYARARETIAEVRRCLAGPVPRSAGHIRPGRTGGRPRVEARPGALRGDGLDDRRLHSRGRRYQVVPSQRWCAEVPVSAFSIYRGLRAINPSPYMYFLDFGDFEIAGASPEPLITVTGRHVSTRRSRELGRAAPTRPRTYGLPARCSPILRSGPSM